MEEQDKTILDETEHIHGGKYVRVRRKRKSNTTQKIFRIISIIGIVLGSIIAVFGAIAIVNFISTYLR